MTFYHQYGLPVTALRLTAVVGPGGRGGGRGWLEFAEMLAAGESVQIPHFSMAELCHYVDLRDTARMHIAAGEHPNAPGIDAGGLEEDRPESDSAFSSGVRD